MLLDSGTYVCAKIYLLMVYDGDRRVGLIGAYVDDCLMCANTQNKVWNQFIAKLKKAFTWSPWESSTFMFTGSRITQLRLVYSG